MTPHQERVGVLLLHGFNSGPHVFDSLIAQLQAAHFIVAAPLLAGHGKTPEDLEKSTWKEWCHSGEIAYKELKTKCDRVFLVGLSMGGNVAAYVASRNKVDGLVLIAMPRWLERHRAIQVLRQLYVWRKKRFYHYKPDPATIQSGDFLPTSDFVDVILPVQSVTEILHLMSKVVPNLLHKVTAPVLVIQSRNDGLVKAASGPATLSALSSTDKRLVWIHGRHSTLKNSTEINELVREFIEAKKQTKI